MDESSVALMSSVPGPDGSLVTSFEANALWEFSGYAVTVVSAAQSGATHTKESYFARKNFDAAIVTLDFKRYSDGSSFRLGLPMFFLSALSVLTFFVPPSERLGYGLSVLVSFQAFQIVVKDSIPDLGYPTNFDYYITDSNILLVCVCCVHAVTGMLLSTGPRTDRYPTRLFFGKVLEFIGRVISLPIAIWLAFVYMGLEENESFNLMVFMLFIPAQIYIFLSEIPAVRGVMRAVSIMVNKQLDGGQKVARLSVIYQGLYRYGTFVFNKDDLKDLRQREILSGVNNDNNENEKEEINFFMSSIGDNEVDLIDVSHTKAPSQTRASMLKTLDAYGEVESPLTTGEAGEGVEMETKKM